MCHIFYACVDGTAEEYTCSSGLWFDEYSGVCNWPEVTDRKDCKADAYGKSQMIFLRCNLSVILRYSSSSHQSFDTQSIVS